MTIIFEIRDKSGRKIHLFEERWREHIKPEHPDIQDTYEIEQALIKPDKIIEGNNDVYNYYKYYKHRKQKSKYLRVAVKYLNNHGFVVTAYFERHIRTR